MPLAHIIKIEDARTGQWLRHLDPVTDPIRRIDMGWAMGDWNQLDVSVETVALREWRGANSFTWLKSVQTGLSYRTGSRSNTAGYSSCGPMLTDHTHTSMG